MQNCHARHCEVRTIPCMATQVRNCFAKQHANYAMAEKQFGKTENSKLQNTIQKNKTWCNTRLHKHTVLERTCDCDMHSKQCTQSDAHKAHSQNAGLYGANSHCDIDTTKSSPLARHSKCEACTQRSVTFWTLWFITKSICSVIMRWRCQRPPPWIGSLPHSAGPCWLPDQCSLAWVCHSKPWRYPIRPESFPTPRSSLNWAL